MSAAPALQRLLYVSHPAPGLQSTDVRRLLAASRIANRRADITGLLLYTGEHFAQVLEGRAEALQPLLQRLQADPRHSRLRVVRHDPLGQRQYGDWSMGYIETLALEWQLGELLRAPSALDEQAPALMHELWQSQDEMGTLLRS